MGLIVRNINFAGNFRGTFPQVPPPPPPPAPSDVYGAYTVLDLPGTGTNNTNNNVFLDSSSNNFAITRFGNTTQGSFSPFSTAPGYWSNYFDGSGDRLSINSSSAFGFGTGDFTLEGWIYPLATNDAFLLSFRNYGANQYYGPFGFNSNKLAFSDGNQWYLGNTDVRTIINTWAHITLCRSNGTLRWFLNGVQDGSISWTTNVPNSPFSVGGADGGFDLSFTGFMSNVRVVKGTALYTTNFTPPTTPLTAVSGTSLLTCQSNRFIDASSNNFAITRNGDTSVSAFGPFEPASSYNASTMGGSMYFDGSSDYLSIAYNPAFNLGTDSFTFEAWINPASISGIVGIFATSGGPEAVPKFVVHLNAGVPSVHFQGLTNGNNMYTTASSAVSANTWTHIAYVRNSSIWTWYINGVASGTGSNSTNITFTSQPTYIGYGGEGYFTPFNGYISNLRLVKGTAVYTSNFTPSTAPVGAISDTSLLLNGTNAAIYDASTKNVLETLGDAKISTTISTAGSMYFDGNGDYLMLPPAQRNLYLTGAFTWEAWVYQTSNGMTMYGNFASVFGDGDRWSFTSNVNGLFSNGLKLFWYRGTYGINQCAIGSTTGVTLNTWNHVAIVRDTSNNIYIFLNGQQLSLTIYNENTTWSNSFSFTNPASISVNGGPDYATGSGYINNMRMTQGIARYTANFTPPTRS